jgi:hypothetical protein
MNSFYLSWEEMGYTQGNNELNRIINIFIKDKIE